MPTSLRRLLCVIAASALATPLVVAGAPAPVEAAACVANNDSVTVLEDTPTFISVLGNDTCVAVSGFTSPTAEGGTATIDPDTPEFGSGFWYTPAANFNGSDSTVYSATSDGSTLAAASVFITVTPVNDPPFGGANPPVAIDEDSSVCDVLWSPQLRSVNVGPANEMSQVLSAVVTGDSNPALFASPPSVLVRGVIDETWQVLLCYTLKPNVVGSTTITFQATDDGGTANGGANTASLSATVNVTPLPDAPTALGDLYGTRPGVTLVVPTGSGVLANDADPDAGDSLVAQQVTGASHGTVTLASDGSFEYVPTAGYAGPDSFTYKAVDTTGRFSQATATINVDGTAPMFTSRTPAAGSTGRPRDTKPTITFNEAINPATITASTFKIKDVTAGVVLSATPSYSASTKRATLTPSALLPAGHTIKVYATSGMKDLAGNAFAGTTWSFKVTSDATRPKVVSKKPAPSSTGISRTANVYATFSEAMRSSTITTSTFRLKDTTTGAIVSATVTYDASLKRAKLDPSATLAAKRTYQVLVSSSIRDKAGNRLYSTSWSFKTGS